jgi:hypothetical protein
VLEKLTHDDFLKWLHQKYEIHHNGATLEVELTECRTLPYPGRKDAERAPFAVIFRGPLQPVLEQRIYKLECKKLEGSSADPLEIFIVPVGRDAVGMRYEAVFS